MKESTNNFKRKMSSNGIFWIAGGILAIYSLLLLAMLFWAVMTTFKDPIFDWLKNKWGLPQEMYLDTYKVLLFGSYTDEYGFTMKISHSIAQLYLNSILYAVGCAFFATVVPCITAYTVAKFGKKYPFVNVYTNIVLICMIIPIVGSTPSEIRIAQALGIYGKIWGIWLMKGYFLGMYFLIFQGTYKSMPDGYAEAAKIDGAGNFTIFFKIYFPLTTKIFATIMLIQGISFWNDYQTPLLYLNANKDSWTLALFQYGLRNGAQEAGFTSVPAIMTTTIFLMLPILLVFIFLNKYIMGNLSLGGLKE